MKKIKGDKEKGLRKQAEKRLAVRLEPSKSSERDTASLIHELQVHQIELEMQNDELRRAQSIIENSHKRFSELYDLAPIGYFTTEKEGIIIEANLRAAEFLGFERQYLIGKPFTVFVHPHNKDIFYLHLRSLCKDSPQTCEIRLAPKGRGYLYARLVSMPLVNAAGAPEAFLVTVLDITAQKCAEEDRDHLAAIVANSYDAVYSKTLEGIIESWNASAQRMYGYTEEDIKGRQETILIPPDREIEMLNILRRIKAGKLVRDFETVRRKKNGEPIEVSLTVSPVKTLDGEIVGASTIARDITDRNQWERSLLELNERLKVSNRGLEDLGHTLSHDLRAPIQSIETLIGILLEKHAEKLDTEGKRMLNIVNEGAQRMRNMITGLLNITSIALAEIRHEKIDMTALVRSIVQECRNSEPTREAEVSIQDDLFAEGEAKLLRMALDNLIRNAWKFTRNRPNALIEFGSAETRGLTAFFLRDNGAGFDMKSADKMFTIFQRFHTNAEFEGTGVGLATAQRIIRRHGGQIWAEAEINKGTTFYFTLP